MADIVNVMHEIEDALSGNMAGAYAKYKLSLNGLKDKALADALDLLRAVRDLRFTVIDKKTGKYPDYCKIALKENWAKGLCYCDMEGIAIEEDGSLVLLDECGNVRYCPGERFDIVWGEDMYGS